MPNWSYIALLVVATIFWGGNFVICKGAVETLGASWVIGIRFLSAGLLMALFLAPRFRKMGKDSLKKLLRAGCIIGVFSFLGYWSQFVGLGGTTPAKNAFLSTCYCVTVPFIWWAVAHKRPTRRNLVAAAICVAGLGFVSLQGDFSISWGDGVSIISAFLYGCEIVAIAVFLKDNDVLCITAVQMASSGALGCLLGLATQGVPDAATLARPEIWGALVYTTLLSSCYGSTAQNIAQTHIPPAQASILFALESVFATTFSVVFWGEELTAQTCCGFVLIFAAILVSELAPRRKD